MLPHFPAQALSNMSKMIPQTRDILLRRVLTSRRKQGQNSLAQGMFKMGNKREVRSQELEWIRI